MCSIAKRKCVSKPIVPAFFQTLFKVSRSAAGGAIFRKCKIVKSAAGGAKFQNSDVENRNFLITAKSTPKSQPIGNNPQFCEFWPQILNLSLPNIETLGAKISEKSIAYNPPKLTPEQGPNSLGRLVCLGCLFLS